MLALSLALGYGLWSEEPQVPDPDRSAMEPQVAAKIAEARGAVLGAPESHEAWGRYGMVLHAHRLEPDAAACYRRASELSPGVFRWQYLLAHALRNADVDAALAAAEGAFKQLSRLVHPDRFATADPRARRASLARTVQLNEAWRTLKDPLLRAEYMLRRAGVDVGDGGKGGDDDGDATVEVAPPPAFLMEILELREELAEGGPVTDLRALAELPLRVELCRVRHARHLSPAARA